MPDTPKMGPEDLDAGRLRSKASEIAGLDDYGDESFLEPMGRWLEALVAEAHLTPTGFMGWHFEVVNLLVNRLRFEDDLKKHPEILEEDVSDPIVVVGLARTGTTKLQRMLSADPSMQKLAFWRLANLAPLPTNDSSGPDPRIAIAHEQLAALELRRPEIMAAHVVAAEEAEEDLLLMEMTFECLLAMTRSRCPSYVDWWLAQPRQRPYTYLHRAVQYLQWQDGGRRGRPWVLKTPAHLGNLDVVFATFPNATVVHCHRDPVVVMGSTTRLTELSYRSRSDEVDMEELGDRCLSFFADEMNRNLDQRELLRNGQHVVDATFADICDDPIGLIRGIHQIRGSELSAEAEARMLQWSANNPQHSHGKFSYSLEDYGVTPQRVERSFARYLDRFGARA